MEPKSSSWCFRDVAFGRKCIRCPAGSNCISALSLICGLAMMLSTAVALTYQQDVDALKAFLQQIGDPQGKLNWTGNDPCGSSWYGVYCNQTQRVQELRLLNSNLTGTLAPELGNLTSLHILDVMWNDISGSIPKELGNLKNLTLLLLNGNGFSGTLPDSLGYLTNLIRLQIDQNNISGPIPKSFQNLSKAMHFHMNNNSLDGSIPLELGQLQSLLHLLLDNNKLSGPLPSELSNMSSLRILQLDNNQLNETLPLSYYNMSKLFKLSLRNCSLSGIIQNLTSLTSLKYLDLSWNQLIGGIPSDKLPMNLTTFILSENQLNGTLPNSIMALSKLQYLELRNCGLNGTVPYNLSAGVIYPTAKSKLIIDLRDNNLQVDNYSYSSNVTFWLNGNPACNLNSTKMECAASNNNASIASIGNENGTVTSSATCNNDTCPSQDSEVVYSILEQYNKCVCASPLIVGYRLKSPSFSYFPQFEDSFVHYLSNGLNVFPYQLYILNSYIESGARIGINFKLFPNMSLHQFNDSEVTRLYNSLSRWVIPDDQIFGPTELIYFSAPFPYEQSGSSKGIELSSGAFAGIVIGCILFTAAVVASTMLLVLKRHGYFRVKSSRRSGSNAGHEGIKVSGVKYFTFEEMALATNSFSSSMQVGQGGYGKVYKGVLADEKVVAIKRAQEGSLQGSNEFYTEIELLSRVHHRNLVSLVGYCDDEGEQMLVYEYMENGTLRDHLSSLSKRPLDFHSRVQIALGSARGILYLHTEADPPIFHRDIKASNILLDHKNKAKVADFGLSKLAPVSDVEGVPPGHVSTAVKGTPGYLDPEYYLTHKLTDKSDVYSFGVVLLELITGMHPISHGKNLVREVNMAYEAGMMLSFVDPRMGSYPSESLEPLVRLAISCCKDEREARPSMAQVVRDLEDILRTTACPDLLGSVDTSDMSINDTQKTRNSFRRNLYSSADIDESELLSGTILNVVPR